MLSFGFVFQLGVLGAMAVQNPVDPANPVIPSKKGENAATAGDLKKPVALEETCRLPRNREVPILKDLSPSTNYRARG
jgi:hypothetical protein